MKTSLLFLVFITIWNNSLSQNWIAGDSTNFYVIEMEQNFEQDSKITFDLDCDGNGDFNIQSSGPTGMQSPWERLSFYMNENVQVYNANSGLISTFNIGQSVSLEIDTNWTASLDFIYGTGEAGAYGQEEISNKYILFRKLTSEDTFYCPILFSSVKNSFTIHHIFSNCTENPIEVINSLQNDESIKTLHIYPNPATDYLLSNTNFEGYQIYTLNGNLVSSNTKRGDQIPIYHLNRGIYFLTLKINSKYYFKKFVKY